jgi:heme-degrading monooxygenase HmoA
MTTKAAVAPPSPVVLINVFTVKPGRLDEFIAVQTAALDRFRGQVPGWLGSRLHRALDDDTAVMMSVFDSVDSHARWHQTAEFAAHRARIVALVDKAEPRFYTLAHAVQP